MLRSADAAEVAAAAAELYKMTSFSSAVAIDRPEAMTDYDRAVFGSGAGPGAADAGGCGAADFKPGEAHLDGHRYLMGDGFMLNEEEGKDGSVRTRRVAVMHSRNCLDNRSIIGKVPGVFEALLVAIRWQAVCARCRRAQARGLGRTVSSTVHDHVGGRGSRCAHADAACQRARASQRSRRASKSA